MINGKNFLDQKIKNDKMTYENIRKIATGQLTLQQIQIEQETQESISFFKKEKKLFWTFHKEL